MEAKDEELFGAEVLEFMNQMTWTFQIRNPDVKCFLRVPDWFLGFLKHVKTTGIENRPPIQVLLQPSVTVDVFCLVVLGK